MLRVGLYSAHITDIFFCKGRVFSTCRVASTDDSSSQMQFVVAKVQSSDETVRYTNRLANSAPMVVALANNGIQPVCTHTHHCCAWNRKQNTHAYSTGDKFQSLRAVNTLS